MPSASFAHSVTVACDRATIWDTMQHIQTWANIGPVEEAWNPVHDDRGILISYAWSTTVAGRRYEGTAETIEHKSPELFRVSLDGGEVGGILETQLNGSGKKSTDLVVTLDIRSQGMMSSIFFPVIRDAVGKGFGDQVDEFAAQFG